MGAHGGLGQFAQQPHQGRHRLLELVGLAEIALLQHLLDLPIQPEGGLIQQSAVIAGPVLFEELIGVLAGRQVQNPKLQLALHRQLFHLADGPIGRTNTGAVGVEIQNDPLAVADAAQLGDLLTAQGRAEGGHSVGDASGMQGDHIEITLHHHGPVVLADGIGGLIEAKQMLPLLEHFGLGGVEVFRFAAIKAASPETDHPTLTVMDRHYDPMAEAVIKPVAALAGNHQPSSLEKLRGQPFHLLKMLQQTIPLVRRIAELEGLLGGGAQPSGLTEVFEGLCARGCHQLAAKPTGSQGQGPLQLVPAGQLLPQPFLLRTIDRLDRQLISPRQIQHHIAETLALELHQELDGVAASTTGEAVVELLGGRHRHRRFAVVMERTDPDEFPSLLLEHHVLAHHINDVGPFLHGLDRSGVQAGVHHRSILRSRRVPCTPSSEQPWPNRRTLNPGGTGNRCGAAEP